MENVFAWQYFTYITRNLISLCELDLLEIFWEF